MSIKANIEVTTVEELRALTEAKVIEVPKIVYKEKIKTIEVPKIVTKEVVKEVPIVKKNTCNICGTDNNNTQQELMPYSFTGTNGKEYNIKNVTCINCGGYIVIGHDKE